MRNSIPHRILSALLIAVNILHLVWTVWLVAEQVQTGWGFGTNMELAVLYPWLTELLLLPILIISGVYLALSRRSAFPKFTFWLFLSAILQYGITNLFIWY